MRKQYKLRKIIFTASWWIFLILIVYFTSPVSSLWQVLFLVCQFLAIFFSLSLINRKIKTNLLIAFYIVLVLVFRLFGIGSLLNLAILTVIFLLLIQLI